MTKSPVAFPLQIEVNHCAVVAKAVLACKPVMSPSSQVHWRGEGNQYDILGRFWIVLSASEGTPRIVKLVSPISRVGCSSPLVTINQSRTSSCS